MPRRRRRVDFWPVACESCRMLLLIPGPVTTRPEVRAAMAQDIAPWDLEFRAVYARVRERVLRIAHGDPATHIALPLQGCGHFITEAAIRTFIPSGGKLLIPATGAYSDRMIRLSREAGRVPVVIPIDAMAPVDPQVIARALAEHPDVGHVGLVYSETGSGVIHDPASVGAVVRAAGRRMILDAVSAFGALPLDISAQPEIDAAVFSTNKCIEALAGATFAICPTERLLACQGNAGSWSFDLADVYQHTLRAPGSARFTPAAQVISAFDTALDFFEAEGQPARLERYRANARTFYDGMRGLGLTPYLQPEHQGPIIVNIHAPADPNWDLQRFVDALKARGVLISNFYNTPRPTFRVGCIGAITPRDMVHAVQSMAEALNDLGITRREAAL